MSKAHCRIGSVDSLPAGTGCAEKVEPDVTPVEFNIKLSRLREDCNGRSGSLDTTLSLGLGHTLYAVYSGFVFHNSIYSVGIGAEFEHYLLEAAGSSRSLVGHLELPAL